MERLAKDTQLQVLRGRETQRIALAFNQRTPPFQDVRAQQAVLGHGINRHTISWMALLGQAQPLWSVAPQGARDPLDFGEQFPYNSDKVGALPQEAIYDEQSSLRYTRMAYGVKAALPPITTIMQTRLTKIGVEVIDRPIVLRRFTTDRDGE